MIYKIPRVLSQVCHQDAGRAVGAHLQHNSSILERIGQWLGAVCLLVLMQGAALAAESFPARVLRVVDGDTLWVMPQHEVQVRRAGGALERSGRIKLRIEGIDAPEICQAHGRTAQRFLERWVLQQTVQVHVQGSDRYRRLLVQVQAQDGQDIGAVMVREGHAWSYRTGWTRGIYAAEERAAMREEAGLFADPKARYPRDFRAVHGPCHVVPRQKPMPSR